jgi:hypothetical protein
MTDEPREQPSRFKPMTLALAGLGVLSACTALLPEADRPWNFAVIGSIGLFAFARLPLGQALLMLVLSIAIKDASIYFTFGWPPEPLAWLGFAAYAVFGRAFLRRTESPIAIGSAAIGASLIFFLISNFGSWLQQSLPYGYSLAGLLDCYEAGIPFYRGTLISDVFASGTLFALHTLLSHAYFPAELVVLEPEVAR